MTPRMKLSRAGLKLIQAHEGFRGVSIPLADGGWVVGYSHLRTAGEGVEIDEAEAEELLLQDLEPVIAAVNDLVFAPINQNQFDALASLAFSIGVRAFRLSGIVGHLNAGRPMEAAAGFDVWRMARIDGAATVIDALVRRRATEKALFLAPERGTVAAPSAELRPIADPDAVGGAPMRAQGRLDPETVASGGRVGPSGALRAAQAAAEDIVEKLARILPGNGSGGDAEARRAEARWLAAQEGANASEDALEIHTGAPPDDFDEDAVLAADMPRRAGGVAREQPGWYVLLFILGAVVLAGSVYEISRFAETMPSPFGEAAWPAAAVAGGLAIVASVYLAVRRLTALQD